MTINGTGRHGSQPPSLTGRDGYIIAQALYWFIRTQQSLPEERFERSNTEDAKLILLTWLPSYAKCFEQTDQLVGRKPANLGLEEHDRTLPATLRTAGNIYVVD